MARINTKKLKKEFKNPIITRSSQWIRSTESGVIRTIKALGDTVTESDVIFHIAQLKDLEIAENKMEYFNEDAIQTSEFTE